MNNAMNSYMLEIVFELLSKKKVSVRDLSLKLELSTRTIMRYIDAIGAAGIPIVSKRGKGGGIYISDSFRISSMFFTAEEMARIRSALDLMSANSTDDMCERIGKKLQSLSPARPSTLLSSDKIVIEGGSWGDLKRYRGKVEAIESALINKNVITVTYRDRHLAETTRRIEPRSFVLKDGIWYVHAYCRLREEFRLFKISRIVNMLAEDETFENRPLPEKAGYNLDFPSEDREIDLILKVSDSVRPGVEEWLGAECVTRSQSGDFIASATLPDIPDLRGRILSFGGGVEILAPDTLRAELKALLLETLKKMG